MPTLRTILIVAAALGIVACKDEPAPMDSELARDIALASAQPPTPLMPQDTALSAATPERTPAAPARTPTPTRTASTPRRETPREPVQRPSAPRVETPRPVTPEPEPEPTPAPAPVERMRGFLAGTSFGLTTKSPVCTNGNRPGDKIVATLVAPVDGENGAHIPAGASVVLEVASITPGDSPESAAITLRVRSIIVDGEPRSVDANVTPVTDLQRTQVARDEGSDKKKVIGGAIAGAIIGQIAGRDTKSTVIGAAAGAAAGAGAAALSRKYDACLPAGAEVRVVTNQPLVLSA